MDRQPKFKYGDTGLNTETGIRIILKNPISKNINIRKNGRLARKDEFEGEYHCFWHDEKGETVYGTIYEEFFQLTA